MILNMVPGGGNVSVAIDGQSYEGALSLETHYSDVTLVDSPTSSANVKACAEFNNKLYAFTSSSSYNVYSFDGTTWAQEPSLPASADKAFVMGNELYAMSGRNIYKLGASSWTLVATTPAVGNETGANQYVRDGTVAVLNNEVHMVLGWQTGTSSFNFKYHYKWNGTTFTSVSEIPTQGYVAYMINYNNQLYLVAGPYTSAKTFYRWTGSSWTNLGTLTAYPNSQNFAFYTGKYLDNNVINLVMLDGSSSNAAKHRVYNGSSWSDGFDISLIPNSYAIMCGIFWDNGHNAFTGRPSRYTFGKKYYLEV